MSEDAPSPIDALVVRIRASALLPVLEQSPEGVVLLAGDRCVYVNPAFAEWLGAAAETLVGRSLLEHVHAGEREAFSACLSGGAAQVPFRFNDVWGDTVSVELGAVGRCTIDGVELTCVSARDVTEARRRAARMLLADRMLSVGTLAAGVAHEINNPLSYVIGNLSFLAEELPALIELAKGAKSTSDLLEAIDESRQGAERVRQIVRDLQAFSRADHQSSPSIDVRRTIELAINMAWIEIRHRARLIKDFNETPLVEASEARLGQVFLSLLLDAAHALPEGSADKHQLRIATRSDDEHVIVEISHTGPPPAPEVLHNAFDPFSPKGVGLAIAHGIVVDLGGEITVEAMVPTGTRFAVRLVPAAVLAKRARASAPRTGRGRVLVVDDEPLLASSIRRALRDHEVTVVESGRSAIAALSGEPEFDLVLCDLMMPELTGMDVYEWVRGAHPGVEERIVFMTGGTFTSRANEFLRTVPNHRFEKPFELDKIRDFVRAYIERARNG